MAFKEGKVDPKRLRWTRRHRGTPWLLGIEVQRIYLWDEPMGWAWRVGLIIGEVSW